MDDVFGELCMLACDLSNAARSAISYRDLKSGRIEEIARSSGLPRQYDISYALPKIGRSTPVFLVSDVKNEPTLTNYNGAEIVPNLRSFAAYWLGFFDGHDHNFIIWNPAQSFFNSTQNERALDHIVSVMRDLLKRHYSPPAKNVISSFNEEAPQDLPVGFKQSGGAASRFLIDTLIKKQRLLARNGCAYVALRQWRKAIKPYQISALTALKSRNDDSFEEEIAAEMAAAIMRVYGNAFQYVVPIPGGSSGRSDSLSVKLAGRIAKLLKSEYANVLVGQPVAKGKSHPAKSALLQPYVVKGNINGNVLIVDDVSSSGQHIELATKALRPLSTYCTSVVWIAD